LSSEYRFDYAKAKPDRFAERMSGGTNFVSSGTETDATRMTSRRLRSRESGVKSE